MSALLANFEGIFPPSSREAEVLRDLDPSRLPRHIAIIMDGNGRWAAQRQMPRVAGHRAGTTAVRAVIETSARLQIPVLTLYAFSVENWKRPASEVGTLMRLLKEYIRKELAEINRHNIRFSPIGRIEELAPSVRRELDYAREATSGNSGMQLQIALNYSGRLELVDAVNEIIRAHRENGAITEADISEHLYTRGVPDPDLMIRTSGEMRVSNFLLWQIAYAEIYVTDIFWPDFRALHLLEAIANFQKRERRYGGIRPQATHAR